MQAKEELLEQLGESYGYVNRFVDKKIEYAKLNVAETSAKVISGVVTAIVLAVIGIITLIFALVTLALALMLAFDHPVYGFGLVTLILLAIFLLVLLLKKQLITNPAVSKVISAFFKHDGQEV
jgi:hypothetical protein